MNEHEDPSNEQEISPEEWVVQLTTQARELLDTTDSLSETTEDGTTVRLLRPTQTSSSSYTFATLKELTPPTEEEPTQYEYSYVLYDRPNDTQILQWTEGSSAIVHGVKMTGYPEDPLQVVKTIPMTADVAKTLERRLHTLEANHKNDLIAATRRTEAQPTQRPTRLSRIQKALGGIISRK